jgi:hypothetical protein
MNDVIAKSETFLSPILRNTLHFPLFTFDF